MNIPLHQAMGAALIAAACNSLVASVYFAKYNFTHIKLGILLETSTLIGAITGAMLLKFVSVKTLTFLLAFILIFSFISSNFRQIKQSYDYSENFDPYSLTPSISKVRLFCSWIILYFAGILSGLLGIGAGFIKVLSMDIILKMPYKISTSTSNFMIGMTAIASSGIYFHYGYINYKIIYPVLLGISLGSMLGAKLLKKLPDNILRILMNILICVLAFQLILKGLELE